MTGEELENELKDILFRCDVLEFRECREKDFCGDSTAAKKFFKNYLIAECNWGVIHTPEQLLESKKEIEELLRQNQEGDEEKIFSEDLPLNPAKQKKSLDNVFYVRRRDSCFIEDKEAKEPQR